MYADIVNVKEKPLRCTPLEKNLKKLVGANY